jgi:protein SCO1/2
MLAAMLAVLAGSGAYAAWLAAHAPPAFHGTSYQPVARAADFALRDQSGRPVSLASYQGRPLLLFFGYTRCSDFCPNTLDRLTRALRELGKKSGGAQVVLVTVDPAYDTPAVLREYLRRYRPAVAGLSGDSAALARVWAGYSVYVAPRAEAPPAVHAGHAGHAAAAPGATAHSGVIYGVDRAGNLRVVMPEGATVEARRDDIRTLARL